LAVLPATREFAVAENAVNRGAGLAKAVEVNIAIHAIIFIPVEIFILTELLSMRFKVVGSEPEENLW